MCLHGFRTMSSSIVHSCPFCGHITNISEILADFVGNPHCTKCGLSASEGNSKAQDDLVSLFNTHMNMEPSPIPAKKEAPMFPQISYSITQHYHHSAHVAQRTADLGIVKGNTSSGTNRTTGRVFEMLRHHNINPTSLSSSQLDLFANAVVEQQSRLIQMWQICPEPNERVLEINQPTQAAFAKGLEMCDSTQEPTDDDNAHPFAEPYMLAGYDFDIRDFEARKVAHLTNEPTTGFPYRLSSDPIYQSGGQRWWERTQSVPMEH
ncbi:hypothetical protein BDW62DRAFT_193067 [Aspergillus aurantiobrunneus]